VIKVFSMFAGNGQDINVVALILKEMLK